VKTADAAVAKLVDVVVVAADETSAAAQAVVPGKYPRSVLPLANGDGPEGYPIKGNEDSMKYHEPGGRWFDATIAEVWFRTAADAEAAGFLEAGSKASIEESHHHAEEAGK
jgi:hypothetical protein